MKLLSIAIALFISTFCLAQKKDSLPPKPDTATIIMNEFLMFLQDKITVKDYSPVLNYVQAFIKSKEYNKPKTK